MVKRADEEDADAGDVVRGKADTGAKNMDINSLGGIKEEIQYYDGDEHDFTDNSNEE